MCVQVSDALKLPTLTFQSVSTQIQKLCCQNAFKCRSVHSQRKFTSVWTQSRASVRRGDFNTHAVHLNHVRVSAASVTDQLARKSSTTITKQIQSRLIIHSWTKPSTSTTPSSSSQNHITRTQGSAAVSYLRCWSHSVSSPDSVRPEPPPLAAASSSSSTLSREIKHASRRSRPALCEREMRRARVFTPMCLISAHVL